MLINNDLIELSAFLGKNLDWVQGAGGNTSVKENGILWVKASGYWLSDSNRNIFVPLDRKVILDKIALNEEDISASKLFENKYQNLRPSIETTMHALMPHKFIAHIHSANVISHAVLSNCNELLNYKLAGCKWLLIPYIRPGLPLTQQINSEDLTNIDIIILENHGLVIGGETKEEVLSLLDDVEKKLSRPLRKNTIISDVKKLINLICNLDYKLPKYHYCHTLASDELSIEVLKNNALYPDHVIFLGPSKIPVISADELDYLINKNSQLIPYKVIVIKEFGVIVHKSLSENAEEMLFCLTNVILRLQSKDKLKFLTQQDEANLIGWDAEKYRKLIQR